MSNVKATKPTTNLKKLTPVKRESISGRHSNNSTKKAHRTIYGAALRICSSQFIKTHKFCRFKTVTGF